MKSSCKVYCFFHSTALASFFLSFSFVGMSFQMWGHWHLQGQLWTGMSGKNKGWLVYLRLSILTLYFSFTFPQFKVIIDIVGVMTTIFVTIFYLLPLFLFLFLSSTLFLFCGFNWTFYVIWFSFLFFNILIILFLRLF